MIHRGIGRLSRRTFLRASLTAGAVACAAPLGRGSDRHVVAAALPVTPDAATNHAVEFERLGALVSKRMEQLMVPGVALGIIADGKTYAAGFGVTNVDHPLPVDAHTLFQIGSTTKTYTGTAIMRLVERGALDLDAPLRRDRKSVV